MIHPFLLILLFIASPLSGEEPFTAKVIKKKVRLRTTPTLDAPIVRELSLGDLIVVDGEQELFYQVRPPRGLKLYLFRTFVLDGTVEGQHVNVRLAPDLESPVVAQLNTGDPVVGAISNLHPKWMEIAAPEQVRFYVAKDFVEKVGDANFLSLHEERSDEVKQLLATGEILRKDLEAPFEAVSLDAITAPFKRVIDEFKEFPGEIAIAQDCLRDVEQAYLIKKVAYLEERAASALLEPVSEEMALSENVTPPQLVASTRAYWMDIEKKQYLQWRSELEGEGDPHAFYKAQLNEVEVLRGVLEPYLRPVKEKPGDFVLLDKESRSPIAYLYSTRINLLDQVGKEVELKGLIRPNNLFNHPAFFVWEIQHVPTPVVGGLSGP